MYVMYLSVSSWSHAISCLDEFRRTVELYNLLTHGCLDEYTGLQSVFLFQDFRNQCIFNFRKNVRLGEYDTAHEGPDCRPVEGGGEDCTEDIVIIPIAKTIPHAEYSPLTRRHDIGLIRMQQAAPYTGWLRF